MARSIGIYGHSVRGRVRVRHPGAPAGRAAPASRAPVRGSRQGVRRTVTCAVAIGTRGASCCRSGRPGTRVRGPGAAGDRGARQRSVRRPSRRSACAGRLAKCAERRGGSPLCCPWGRATRRRARPRLPGEGRRVDEGLEPGATSRNPATADSGSSASAPRPLRGPAPRRCLHACYPPGCGRRLTRVPVLLRQAQDEREPGGVGALSGGATRWNPTDHGGTRPNRGEIGEPRRSRRRHLAEPANPANRRSRRTGGTHTSRRTRRTRRRNPPESANRRTRRTGEPTVPTNRWNPHEQTDQTDPQAKPARIGKPGEPGEPTDPATRRTRRTRRTGEPAEPTHPTHPANRRNQAEPTDQTDPQANPADP
jgi:hypothetical protein